MNSELQIWKCEEFLMLLYELNLKNKRIGRFVKRLFECWKIKQGKEKEKFEKPERYSFKNESSVYYFRGRGENFECEMCGKYIHSSYFTIHLKSKHDVFIRN